MLVKKTGKIIIHGDVITIETPDSLLWIDLACLLDLVYVSNVLQCARTFGDD